MSLWQFTFSVSSLHLVDSCLPISNPRWNRRWKCMLASSPYSQLYHSYPSWSNQCLSLVFPLWVMKANKFYPWTMLEHTILTLVLYLKLILVWIGMLSTSLTYGYGWNEGGDTTAKDGHIFAMFRNKWRHSFALLQAKPVHLLQLFLSKNNFPYHWLFSLFQADLFVSF